MIKNCQLLKNEARDAGNQQEHKGVRQIRNILLEIRDDAERKT